jgi:MoaA/NifB/PqqE/SkfB family radical SAM enzyme
MPMNRCSAAWYELNISAPDNIVSACCYYAGPKQPWSDAFLNLADYWNSPEMQTIRRINSGKPAAVPNGCSDCFYFTNRVSGATYYDFDISQMPTDLSEMQRANWLKAKSDFDTGAIELSSTPLRIYANFGFGCNLSCTMCHQVPRRATNRRQVLADNVLGWREGLQSALEVTVIGGEPFALPEAVDFIRRFIRDPEFDPVRLVICTNGTVHHKHMKLLQQKRKLSMAVSLDSIYEGYERIRIGGKWDVVERNILMFVDAQRKDHPEWSLQTNGLIMKTGVPLLPAFARWHAQHGIITSFYDFINSRGTEDAYYRENILHNPQILDDMPEWEDYFHEAVEIFRKADLTYAADSLDHYRARVVESVAAHRRTADRLKRNDWTTVLAVTSGADFGQSFGFSSAEPGRSTVGTRPDGLMQFANNKHGAHFGTRFYPVETRGSAGDLKVRALWPTTNPKDRLAHLVIQRQDFIELECHRETRSLGSVTEMSLGSTLSNKSGVTAFRVVILPTGEEESLIPSEINVEVTPDVTVLQEATVVKEATAPIRSGRIFSSVNKYKQRLFG